MPDKPGELDRLEAEARERWGDNWTIRTLRFSDGSTSSYAFRSRGVVDRDDLDEKVLEHDRLFTDDDGRLHYARIQFVDRRVIDQLDHEVVQMGYRNGDIRQEVLARDDYECQECGDDLKSKNSTMVHIHHRTEQWRGGGDHTSNLISLCEECHRELHAREMSADDPRKHVRCPHPDCAHRLRTLEGAKIHYGHVHGRWDSSEQEFTIQKCKECGREFFVTTTKERGEGRSTAQFCALHDHPPWNR